MELEAKKEPNNSSIEHKKKVLWGIFAKLDKASQGCGEVDLPLFGETLLMQCEELIPDESNNKIFKKLKEIIEKIRNCEPNPDKNILSAKSFCQELLKEIP